LSYLPILREKQRERGRQTDRKTHLAKNKWWKLMKRVRLVATLEVPCGNKEEKKTKTEQRQRKTKDKERGKA
jgi:hypothetical protein